MLQGNTGCCNYAVQDCCPTQSREHPDAVLRRSSRTPPLCQDSGLHSERRLRRNRVTSATRERERVVEQMFNSFHANAKVSRSLSIFFIFARARNARTLVADRLQPVNA